MQENIALTEAVFYILLSLNTPLHGYGIMQAVAQMSGGRVVLAAGTLYGALSTMQEKGWIRPASGGDNLRKKEYELTEEGRLAARNELSRLEELVENGKRIIWGGRA